MEKNVLKQKINYALVVERVTAEQSAKKVAVLNECIAKLTGIADIDALQQALTNELNNPVSEFDLEIDSEEPSIIGLRKQAVVENMSLWCVKTERAMDKEYKTMKAARRGYDVERKKYVQNKRRQARKYKYQLNQSFLEDQYDDDGIVSMYDAIEAEKAEQRRQREKKILDKFVQSDFSAEEIGILYEILTRGE